MLLLHAYIKAALYLIGGFVLLIAVCNVGLACEWADEMCDRIKHRRELRKLARRYYKLYAEADTDRLRGYYYARYRMYEEDIKCR